MGGEFVFVSKFLFVKNLYFSFSLKFVFVDLHILYQRRICIHDLTAGEVGVNRVGMWEWEENLFCV